MKTLNFGTASIIWEATENDWNGNKITYCNMNYKTENILMEFYIEKMECLEFGGCLIENVGFNAFHSVEKGYYSGKKFDVTNDINFVDESITVQLVSAIYKGKSVSKWVLSELNRLL